MLVFDSRVNYLKTFTEGSEVITTASTSRNSVTVAHNLGYIPFVQMWYTDSTGEMIGGEYPDDSFTVAPILDTSNLYIKTNNNSISSITVTAYYKIYYDTVVV